MILTGGSIPSCYTFQWKKNGVVIAGAKGNFFTAKESGTYTVTVSYFGNFAHTSAPVVITVSPTQPVVTANVDTLTSTAALTYQWYYSIDSINYNAVPGGNAQTLISQTVGWYYVLITDANGCSDTSVPYHLEFAGIDNIHADFNFYLSPNPADEFLNLLIHSKTLSVFKLEIVNTVGQKLFEKNYQLVSTAFQTSIKINQLQSGVYFVKVSDEKSFRVMRFVIE
ncbi:MAG: T9SS type A sorting domain-containing protein [Bacteroidia bacterium]